VQDDQTCSCACNTVERYTAPGTVVDRWRCEVCMREFMPASTALQELCDQISTLLEPHRRPV